MKDTWQTIILEHGRAAILQALDRCHGTANERLLKDLLKVQGINWSSDTMRGQLAWLEEQGLIRTRQVETIIVAELTERGADAAAGTAAVPGVARLKPEQ